MAPSIVILCEIFGARGPVARELALIARQCADDVGLFLVVKNRRAPAPTGNLSLTLHLSSEVAAGQNPVWCLACRLACFCPQARVGVMIHGEKTFHDPISSQPIRQPA